MVDYAYAAMYPHEVHRLALMDVLFAQTMSALEKFLAPAAGTTALR